MQERRPGGEVSTVGLFYTQAEAEGIILRLRRLPEKQDCEYLLVRPGEDPLEPR